MDTNTAVYNSEIKVFLNHVYEFQKGVRRMILYTTAKKNCPFMLQRLESRNIDYIIQPAGPNNINLFFGRKECIQAIRCIVTRPLNKLSPEEDFILGTMLGYDLCAQCERFCKRKAELSRQSARRPMPPERQGLIKTSLSISPCKKHVRNLESR